MAAATSPLAPVNASQPPRPIPVRQSKAFNFVTQNPFQKPCKDQQKLIRSHASRGRRKKKREPLNKSWILQRCGMPIEVDGQYTSIPNRVGSDLSFFKFPIELQPYMQGDIARAIGPMRSALYPPDICMQVDPALSSWTTNLLADLLYLHCTLFSVEAFLDTSLGRATSSLTQFHLLKTLRLLQDRLDAPHDPQSITDATIMVVSVLALTAELHGDMAAADVHMRGLERMIKLRGGLEMLRFDNSRLPAKVCRVDLSVAIRFGRKPIFFGEAMSWDPFINLKHPVKHAPQESGSNSINRFIQATDENLYHTWKDLQAFCRLCNLASQTPHKLLPNTFSEIMESILYRLINLSFESMPVLDAIRLGMMIFASHVFLQWRGMRQRQTQLDDDFGHVLLMVKNLKGSETSPELILWLLVLWHTCSTTMPEKDALTGWLRSLVKQLGLDTWKDVRAVLKPLMWIDVLFDKSLAQLFDSL